MYNRYVLSSRENDDDDDIYSMQDVYVYDICRFIFNKSINQPPTNPFQEKEEEEEEDAKHPSLNNYNSIN